MKVIPFETAHLIQLSLQDGGLQTMQSKYIELTIPHIHQMGPIYERDPAYTVIHNGIIYGCGGIVQTWQGVGKAWTYISSTAINNKRVMAYISKQCLTNLDDMLEEEYFHRVECDVAADHEKGIQWASRFGFVNEGLMKAYGADKSDWIRFAKVRC